MTTLPVMFSNVVVVLIICLYVCVSEREFDNPLFLIIEIRI